MPNDKIISLIAYVTLFLLMVVTAMLYYTSTEKEEKNRYEIISSIYLAAMLMVMILNK